MFRHLRPAVFTLFALLLILLPLLPASAQDETPEAECVTTTPEENKALATAYWDEVVWAKQGKIAEIVALDEIHHWGIAGTTEGFDAFSERWNLFLTAFPDLEFTVDLVAADGDLAATAWTANGTQAGEWQGIAPTNKEVSWTGINVFRVACGQIIESWGEADHIGLLAALGAADMPKIPAASAGDATPVTDSGATPCAGESADGNLAVATRWTNEVWSEQNLDVLDDIAHPAITHHGASFPDTHGVEELKQGIGRQFAAFPDMELTVDSAFADGDTVVVRWSGTGTNESEFLGLPPSGQETTMTGINIYRLACGQIVESWSEMNGLALIRQIQEADGAASATPAA